MANPVASPDTGHAAADVPNRARELVAEDTWRFYERVLTLEDVDVGSAHATQRHLHQHVAPAQRRHGPSLQPQVMLPVPDRAQLLHSPQHTRCWMVGGWGCKNLNRRGGAAC